MARVKIDFSARTPLPAVCVCCGRPAAWTRGQVFSCSASVSPVAFLAGLSVGLLVSVTRQVALTLPVCDGHRQHGRFSNRVFYGGMIIAAVLAAVGLLLYQFEVDVGGWIALSGLGVFLLGWAVAGITENGWLSVSSLTDRGCVLHGVSREFAEEYGRTPDELVDLELADSGRGRMTLSTAKYFRG